MIVKFFSNKKGGGISSVNYLLDKRTELGTAKILQGDEQITRSLIKSMRQKHKACVGCLSFEEKNLNETTKKEIMQSFENMLLTPAMQGRYNILWVEHTDKGRLELNFVIPKIDLESKKAFNPYFHMADLKRKDLWTDFVNLKHSFSNPKDPAKENTIQGSKKEIGLFNDYEALDKFLHEKVSQGLLTSRKSIVELLRANSIEVTRESKEYISIKLPESKKAKRFKGGIYDEEFRSIGELETIHKRAEESAREFNQRDHSKELRRLERELNEHIQSKARFYNERNAKHAIRTQQNTHSLQMEQHHDQFPDGNFNDDDFKRSCVVSVDKTLSNIQRSHSQRQEWNDLHRYEQNSKDSISKQNLYSDPIKGQDDDNLRSGANSRSGEITRRIRICFNTTRENAERKQRTNSRSREIDRQVSRLRELIQSKFREFTNTIKRTKELIKQRIKRNERGFSR